MERGPTERLVLVGWDSEHVRRVGVVGVAHVVPFGDSKEAAEEAKGKEETWLGTMYNHVVDVILFRVC